MKIIKKIQIIFLALLLISCKSAKKSEEIRMSFQKYLESRNINIEKLDDSNYTDFYMDFLDFRTKNTLSKNSFLKLNKVYMYEGQNIIAFCIFADDGSEYIARVNKNNEAYLTAPNNKIISIKQKIKLDFLGDFILQDSIIKISRNERRPWDGKEWNECDVGYIKEENIYLRENYNTKIFSYKKKWLAKTYKTNLKLSHQENINAIRFERTQNHNPYYLIEGSFKIELEPEKDRMMELLEKAKF